MSNQTEKRNPLITVIVPVYNAESYLEKCVNSILQQSYTNFELILINDGSRDNSLALCNKLSKEDRRIVVCSQSNQGAGAARNKGLQVARGRYIAFVDSDDYVSQYYLENMYLALLSGPYDIVQCKMKRTRKQADPLKNVLFEEKAVREITKEQALNKRLYLSSVCGKLYSSHILKEFRFREGIIYEDDASYYRMVNDAERIALLDEELYCYYLSNNSVMRNGSKNQSNVFVDIYEERIQFFKDRKEPVLLEGSYARFCLVLMLRISRGIVQGNNADDIEWYIALFHKYYAEIRMAKHVAWKDRLMLACFHISPRWIGWVIGMIRILK